MILQGNIDNEDADDDDGAFDNNGNAEFGDGNAASDDDSMDYFDERCSNSYHSADPDQLRNVCTQGPINSQEHEQIVFEITAIDDAFAEKCRHSRAQFTKDTRGLFRTMCPLPVLLHHTWSLCNTAQGLVFPLCRSALAKL
jgi:hypothetical protein